MTLLDQYRTELLQSRLYPDPAQEQAVYQLQRLLNELVKDSQRSAWLSWIRGRKSLPKGLYLWGEVGRGKTFLMDMFYECIPFPQKLRMHFHRFMQRVHNELKQLPQQKDPLVIIGKRLAREARVLCFDEFFVSDIADAMLLSGLLQELFKQGITLVATSNIVPDQLYTNGLQRERFLPAIQLINANTNVLYLKSAMDYRLRALEKAEIYHYPLDIEADKNLLADFSALTHTQPELKQPVALEILDRTIPAKATAEGVLWIDFADLCAGPRSQNDYIELARLYHTVLLSNVPQLGAHNDDAARRFVSLVDEFYDRNVKLIMTAATALDALYTQGKLNFEFARTRSRLLEMQSREYLSRAHQA